MYDPVTGTYDDLTTFEDLRYGHISELSLEKQNEIVGQVNSLVLVVRVLGPVNGNPKEIRIGDAIYKVIRKKLYRNDTSFYIQGVKYE